MGKKFINANSVEEYICMATKKIYVDGIILSSCAKDKLRDLHIDIEYGPVPENVQSCDIIEKCTTEACSNQNGDDNIALAVVQIIEKEFGITDYEQMSAICCKIIKSIKEQ